MENVNNIISWNQFKNRLKFIPRTGWLELGVPADKVESVYSHISSTKDLVSEFNEKYNLKLNIEKINKMITIKELFKAYTLEEKSVISGETSKEINRNITLAIKEQFNLPDEFIELYDEFQLGESNEAIYALLFSKFESDLQAVNYYEMGLISLDSVLKDIEYYPEPLKEEVKELLSRYPIAPLAWLTFDSKYYKGNDLFESLSRELISYCIKKYENSIEYKKIVK